MARPCLLTMYELYYYTYPYIGYGGMGVPFFFFFFSSYVSRLSSILAHSSSLMDPLATFEYTAWTSGYS